MSSADRKDQEHSREASLSDVEAETLALLRKHGVSEQAIRNFDDETTAVVEAVDPSLPIHMDVPAKLVREVSAPEPRPAIIFDLLEDDMGPRPTFDCLWVLASEDGLAKGRTFSLSQQCLIGRGSQCAVQISSDSVSRTHALIEWVEDGVALFDMNSTNGLLLNRKRLTEKTRLKDGDRIQVARTVFEVVLGRGSP